MIDGRMDRGTTIRVLRLIVVALVAGLVSFAAIVLLVLEPFEASAGSGGLLAALLGLAAVLAVAYPVVRKLHLAGLRRRHGDEAPEDNEPALLQGYQTLTLIGAAMTESVGLFAVVVHLVAVSSAALGVAGAAVALLLLQLPSVERYRDFAEQVTGHRPR